MLLVMDVGNTNTVVGVYDGNTLINSWRLVSDRERSADEFAIVILGLFRHHGLSHNSIDAIAVSSVVPPMMGAIEQMCRKYFGIEPLVIGPGVKTGINILYENPKEVGADRIVNAVAAYEMYGGPIIVVDFGTATTFCAISEKGEYLGGCVAPGITISTEALYQRAAKLPKVELVRPPRVICKNTVNSMQAGIIYGYVGQVDYIVKLMKKELGREDTKAIATGGLAGMIAEVSETIEGIEPNLTLEGLRIIYQRNQ